MSADNWTHCPKCEKDFREDYEIGIYDGDFAVRYRGSCGAGREPGCGFTFEFNYDETIPKAKGGPQA